jgi:3-hydroxybutyryl-CoA dehydrogenase
VPDGVAEVQGGSTIETIAVVGAGTMGAGIAQVAAQAGYRVILIDRDDSAIERGRATIQRNWQRAIEREKLTAAEVEAAAGHLRYGTDANVARAAQLAVEAAYEDLEVKRTIFKELDASLSSEAILASNTSSISITALGGATRRPERVVGMHFFNPVPVMRLVEIVQGHGTADSTVAAVADVAGRLGKSPVVVQDFPGFISNRVLMPMINEAIFCLQDGVADRDAIDQVMQLGMAHPMGPLALADLIGLDVCLAILEVLQRDLGEDKYRPAPLLRRLVAAGRLGRKSGEGFYTYDARP